MDRHAIFVDVGYVIAAAAELLTGTSSRAAVQCDYPALIAALVENIGGRTTLPMLRVYWYDASDDGQPQYEQKVVANVQGVRQRLGRVVRREQKGVDSRIIRDLIVLSRDRAIAEAFLVSGDEDLVEGVQEAQDQGVRVELLGVPYENQSLMLTQQVDRHDELPREFWEQFFTPATEPEEDLPPVPDELLDLPEGARPVVPTEADIEAWLRHADEDLPWAKVVHELAGGEAVEYHGRAREAGEAFADQLVDQNSPIELRDLRQETGGRVPADIDRQLLRFADDRLEGVLWERQELKKTIRNAFWERFRARIPPPSRAT